MFSGGLDSLAGTLEKIMVQKSRIVLVTHESTSKNAKVLHDLSSAVAAKAGSARPLHLRVRANKEKALGRDYTQRTRSFLFAAFGATVGRMLGVEDLCFFENGIVSLNLPVSAQVVGSRATRTTHPKVLRGFQHLFSLLAAEEMRVSNPFLLLTKADVIKKIVSVGCGDLIKLSTSCAHTWQRTRQFSHCGVCSQCIDRRLAMEAAGAIHLDPQDHYKTDVFLDPMPADEDKMMLAAYLDRATSIEELRNSSDFIVAFPQITDALQYVATGATKAAAQFYDLYKRHSIEVSSALSSLVKRHSAELVAGRGGAGCLLRTLVDNRGMVGASGVQLVRPENMSEASVEFRGADWLITFAGIELTVRDILGVKCIVFLLQNPHTEFSHGMIKRSVKPSADPELQEALRKSGAIDGIPATDPRTIRAIDQRLRQIEEKVITARSNGDTELLTELEDEEKKLRQYRALTTNIRGAPRTVGGHKESMRTAVLQALRTARKHIGSTTRGQRLYEHLKCIRPASRGHLIYAPSNVPHWTFENVPF